MLEKGVVVFPFSIIPLFISKRNKKNKSIMPYLNDNDEKSIKNNSFVDKNLLKPTKILQIDLISASLQVALESNKSICDIFVASIPNIKNDHIKTPKDINVDKRLSVTSITFQW